MPFISLQQMYDTWKRVSDWVSGASADAPKVSLTGSNVADAQTLWTPGMLYNEATSDKPRGNTQGTLLASAARTSTVQSANLTNYNAIGVQVTLNITSASGTGGLQVWIRGIDSASGIPYKLNASPTAIVATGTYTYEVYPGATGSSGTVAGETVQRSSGALPRIWHSAVVHGDASSYTYSLSYSLIL